LAIPFFDSLGNNTFWDIAQQYANAVNDFDAANADQPSYLTKIDFVCQDITAAGVDAYSISAYHQNEPNRRRRTVTEIRAQ
jgi:hypothetical protein